RYTSARGQPVVTASSALTDHPSAQARSGFDGDPATTWTAADGEQTPAFGVRWARPTRISTITLRRPPAVSTPLRLRLEGARGQVREGLARARAELSFAPLTSDRRTITVFREGQVQPIQLPDVVIPGVRPLPDVRARVLRLPCGYGPKLRVGPSGAVERTMS